MINYLKSILPRIQQHSKMLDDTATFADIPWAFMDDDGHKVTYIFRRNNELLVSKQGEVVTGKWEYLPVMQSLLIELEGRKRMYNQGFLNEAIMLLKKDGTDEIFPLGNLQKLPDLDIERYIEGFLVPNLNKGEFPRNLDSSGDTEMLVGGKKITIKKKQGGITHFDKGNEVVFSENGLNAMKVPDGNYRLVNGNEIEVVDNKISMTYKWIEYKTKEGIVFQIRHPYEFTYAGNLLSPVYGIIPGSPCTLGTPENQPVELDDNCRSILVKNGKIEKIIIKDDYAIVIIIVSAIVLAIILLLILDK